jgi:hypothetical protein
MIAGSIYGLCSEAAEVKEALRSFRPDIIAIGISDEDLEALRDKSAVDVYDSYFSQLSKFGEVSIPSPDFMECMNYADMNGVGIKAISLNDDEFSELLCSSVSSLELVARSRRRTKIRSRSAEDFSRGWDSRINRGGFERINRICEQRMVERIRALAESHERILVLLDLPRFDGVTAILSKSS